MPCEPMYNDRFAFTRDHHREIMLESVEQLPHRCAMTARRSSFRTRRSIFLCERGFGIVWRRVEVQIAAARGGRKSVAHRLIAALASLPHAYQRGVAGVDEVDDAHACLVRMLRPGSLEGGLE